MSEVNLATPAPSMEKEIDVVQAQIANTVVEDRAMKLSSFERTMTSTTTMGADKTITEAEEKKHVSCANSTASTVNNSNMSNADVLGNANNNTLLFHCCRNQK